MDITGNSYRSPLGPAYRDLPVGYANAPLYCVSIGNTLPVSGFGQTDAQGNPILPTQAEGFCPVHVPADRPSGFFDRLTIHFSIGQAFYGAPLVGPRHRVGRVGLTTLIGVLLVAFVLCR